MAKIVIMIVLQVFPTRSWKLSSGIRRDSRLLASVVGGAVVVVLERRRFDLRRRLEVEGVRRVVLVVRLLSRKSRLLLRLRKSYNAWTRTFNYCSQSCIQHPTVDDFTLSVHITSCFFVPYVTVEQLDRRLLTFEALS